MILFWYKILNMSPTCGFIHVLGWEDDVFQQNCKTFLTQMSHLINGSKSSIMWCSWGLWVNVLLSLLLADVDPHKSHVSRGPKGKVWRNRRERPGNCILLCEASARGWYTKVFTLTGSNSLINMAFINVNNWKQRLYVVIIKLHFCHFGCGSELRLK